MKKTVAKTTEKYVTITLFEKAMVSIAKTLANQDTVLSKVIDTLVEIKQGVKEIKNNVSTIDSSILSHDRKIENILTRVEKLEAKVK